MPASSSYRRRQPSPWPLVIAMAVASAGMHLVLWPVGNKVLELGWPTVELPDEEDLMEVALLLPPDAAKDKTLPGQLVDPDRVEDQRPPKDETDKVSAFDSRVEKEVRSPNRKSAPKYDPTKLGEESGASSGSRSSTPSQQPVAPHDQQLGPQKPSPLDDLGGPAKPNELPIAEYGDRGPRAGGTALPPRVGLRGNANALRKTFGGSGNRDDLDDLDEAPESLLNTHRFRFASFFNRMRDRIDEHWDPNEVMHRIDPDRRTYGERDRRTLLHIRLTPKGGVQRIEIVRDSGVIELDKEAIESVHLAGPFPNPPPQMVDPDTGYIEIDFMFTLRSGRARIHRYLR